MLGQHQPCHHGVCLPAGWLHRLSLSSLASADVESFFLYNLEFKGCMMYIIMYYIYIYMCVCVCLAYQWPIMALGTRIPPCTRNVIGTPNTL